MKNKLPSAFAILATLTLCLSVMPILAQPANDQCSGAIPLTSDVPFTMSTTTATTSGDPSPVCGGLSNGVWFTFTPAVNGEVIVQTCDSGFDTVLAVYTGNCASLNYVTCLDDNGPACSGTGASVTFAGTAGTAYHILAGGYQGARGTLIIMANLMTNPPVAMTTKAVFLSDARVTLNGNVIQNWVETWAWFEWGTNYGTSTAPMNLGTGTNTVPVNFDLSGLVAGNIYHYRVVASNSLGMTLGNDVVFSTMFTTNINAGLPQIYGSSVAWGDYDNDGRLDILLQGTQGNGYSHFVQVWRNTGSGFTNINAGLPTWAYYKSGLVAWGDYDNDGRLDILVTGGGDGPYDYIAQVWRNTASGFTNINAGLPQVPISSVAWGDYDNDGRLDILLTGRDAGRNPSNPIAQVWRNTTSGFTNINAGLPQVPIGSVAWGDYDNDGRLDILLTASTDSGYITEIWRNTGSGFNNINAGVPGVVGSSVAWGDYDSDGRLDILLTGNSGSGYVTQVWRNTGSGFTNVNAALPGVSWGSVAWGDYDNDGRLDILLTGEMGSEYVAQVWRNTGTNFLNLNVALPGVLGSVAWGDYDNDGRLDILLTGTTGSTGYMANSIAQVWRNNIPATNTPPTAPTDLVATVIGRSATLTWNPASDVETPSAGLTYNLRVGSSPGAINMFSPQASLATGVLRLPAMGNAQFGLSAVITNLPFGTYYWSLQAVDSAFASSPFAVEGSFVVYLPLVTTLPPATDVTPTSAGFHGTANPMGHETLVWFEYGLDTRYRNITSVTNLGSGTNELAVNFPAAGLYPWLTYHYRAVASNAVGRAVGNDDTFTLLGVYIAALSLDALPDVTLPQGGSTNLTFTMSPTSLDVQVRANNSVLLPEGGLMLGGSGSPRSLSLSPDPNQSGSAQVTVTASDGARAASDTFNLTVTNSAGNAQSALLYLTNAAVVSPQAWRFRIMDAGTGSTNYTVEYRSGLSTTNDWNLATNVTDVGGGVIEVATGPQAPATGFYRVKGFRFLFAGLSGPALTTEEGASDAGAVIVFNGLYNGTVNCIWTDEQGNSWTNQVQVNGTTAVLPIPAAFLSDNTGVGQLKYLTLRLGAGTDYAMGGTTESVVTIEENDAEWLGTLQTANGILGFELTLSQTNGSLQGQIKSGGSGFFPTNALAQLNFTENAFTLVATNIRLPVLTAYPALSFTNYVDLRLDAANVPGETNVSPTQVQGVATLVSKVPNRPYLDAAVSGPFVLLRPPTAPSTNEVPLYLAP